MMKNLLLILTLFFINLSFSNSYIEFNEDELKHFNKYYSFEDFSKIAPRNEMHYKEVLEDANIDFQRKIFLKKAKKNEEDSVFLLCREDKWIFKDSSNDLFLILDAERNEAFISYFYHSPGFLTDISSGNQYYFISDKSQKLKPFQLDTNTLILEIHYERIKFKTTKESRKCKKMNYSKWLSNWEPFVKKIDEDRIKQEEANKEETKLKF